MSKARQNFIFDIVAAFMMLSRLPFGWCKFESKNQPQLDTAGWAFPLVGLVIGAGGAAGLVAFQMAGVTPIGAATIGIIIMTVLSGAIHDDGLADMADGFGGGLSAEDKIQIMHDSRVGSYGVLALCLGTILRVSLLSSLCTLPLRPGALIMLIAFFVAASRWQILTLLQRFPVSNKARLGQLVRSPPLSQFIVATCLWLLPVSIVFGPITGSILAVSAFISAICIGKLAMSQIGGLTGDIMGASVIVSEISMMLTLIMLTSFFPDTLGVL